MEAAALPPLSIGRSVAIVMIGVAIVIAGATVQPATPWGHEEWAGLPFYVLIMGSSAWVGCRLRGIRMVPASFDLRVPPRATFVPLVAGSVALLYGVAAPIGSTIPMSDEVRQAMAELGSRTGIWAFLGFVLAPPILEEILFRGVILDGLLRRYSPRTSILVSSFLFGAVHLNPWQFVTGMLFGVFAGWVYFRSRSLLACIAIHMAANGAGYVTRLFMDPQALVSSDDWLVQSYGGVVPMVIWLTVCVVVLVLSIRSLQRWFAEVGPVAFPASERA
jgi:uncharacterized protein